MSLYSIDKLINETRRLAAEFKRTTGTMLPVSGEIARYDVSHYLDLTLSGDQGSGYDAIGNNQRGGLRVQIKSRVIADSVKSGHRMGQLNPNGSWDIIILSLMNNEFEPFEMYQLSHGRAIEALANNRARNQKNNNISVAKFKILGDLVWTNTHGEILPEYHKLSKQCMS